MAIKRPKAGESAAMKQKRASFKARHAKNISRGKMSAAYWADKTHEMNDYTKAAYQYATSSYPRICTPGAIITATTESDIPKAMVSSIESTSNSLERTPK